MYFVKATYNNESRASYISGVFDNIDVAEKTVKQYKLEGVKFSIEEISAKKFPVYIVEHERDFLLTGDNVDVVDFAKKELKQNEDECYFNLYIVDKKSKWNVKGEDSMGALEHLHVDDRILNEIKTNFEILVKD